MPWRRPHHLPNEVFDGQRHVVSITTCTADQRRWLGNEDLAVIAQDEVMRVNETAPVLGYCLMPDHVHFLLCNAEMPISRIMNLFKGRLSRRVRQIRPDLEQVWQASYWDHIVRREEGLYKVLQYILMNPVRAGLVEDWWTFPWLGSPMLGPIGPDFFGDVDAEDIVWSEILRV